MGGAGGVGMDECSRFDSEKLLTGHKFVPAALLKEYFIAELFMKEDFTVLPPVTVLACLRSVR
jgi:hypothetical protein